MKINSKILALLVFAILFGSILFTTAMGWWKTETTKVPARFTEGEAAGAYNPADIRGSYSFGEISELFNIPLEELGAAFQVGSESDLADFQLKSLEEIYAESPVEIGTSSVRLFVAFYTGLPYELSEESWLLPQAVEILERTGTLTAEQGDYLTAHTVGLPGSPEETPAEAATLQPADNETGNATPTPAAEATVHATSDRTVKGNTTFQNLLDWGVGQDEIEGVIGETMPPSLTVIKDYCLEKGIEFSTVKTALQALIQP